MIITTDEHNIPFIENHVDDENIVILCHGITSSKEEGGFFNDFAKELNYNSLSTIQFDFRGHGDSKVSSLQTTIAGMIVDLNTILNYANKNYSNVSIIAASFGVSILLLLMQHQNTKLKSTILLNTVIDYTHTFTNRESDWSKSIFPSGGLAKIIGKKVKIGDDFLLNPVMALELFYYEPNKKLWQYQKIV